MEFLKAKTCEGKDLEISIKKETHQDMTDWNKDGTHQYCVLFKFINVPNPNYQHSYYIDTIMDPYWNRGPGGLCLNGSKYEYESVSKETMDKVRVFVQEFVDENKIKLHREEKKL